MIAVLSDTHGNVHSTAKALELISGFEPGLILHCGDIGSSAVLELFAGLPARFVFGNVDFDRRGLCRWADILGLPPIEEELIIEHCGRKIFVYHGMDPRRLEAQINSGRFHYIFTGHTHHMRDERAGCTRIINPGALHRAARYTVALLDPEKDHVTFIEVPKDG